MWDSYYTTILHARLLFMFQKVKRLSEEERKGSFDAKLFFKVIKALKLAKQDPTQKEYLQDNTLGKTYRSWRRTKNGLPERYRLFFKFFSIDKTIYFAWLNDENTLRKEGAKTDCYAYFKIMLDSGVIANDKIALHAQSQLDTLFDK